MKAARVTTQDPKQYLLEMMISFSEKQWSSSWCSGLEFTLWKKVRSCSPDLSVREIADFNFYSGLAGGWWFWDKNLKKEVFIPLEDWLAKFAESNH